MTTQNPLDILRQFSPQVAPAIGQFQAAEQAQQRRAMNPLLLEQQQIANQTGQFNLDQAQQGAASNEEALKSQANVQNTVSNLLRLNTAIKQGATPEQLSGMLQRNIQNAQASGGVADDSVQALQALQTQGVEGLKNLAGQATAVFENQGLLKPRAGVGVDFAKINPEKFTRESVASAEQSGKYSDLIPLGDPSKEPVFVGELRKELRTDVGKLEKDATSLTTNFNKLKNLAAEMRTGKNRSAVAQGLVALVKLGDPGSVVKEEELKQALGAQSPTAAIADLLRDKGTSKGVVDAITQSIDPLNPASVNVDSILSTAEAMLRPNADSISSAYQTAKTRSDQLSEGGRRSIFSAARDNTFGDVSGLSFGVEEPIAATEAPAPVAPQPEVVQTFIGPDGQPQDFRINSAGEWEPI